MKKLLSVLLLVSSVFTFVCPISSFANLNEQKPSEEKIIVEATESIEPLNVEKSEEKNDSSYLNKTLSVLKSTPSKITIGSAIIISLAAGAYFLIDADIKNQFKNFVLALLTPNNTDPIKCAPVEQVPTESYLPL